jgi:hypothetical protein
MTIKQLIYLDECTSYVGIYIRVTERRNKDGSTVSYYALAENIWNADAKRSETQVVHSFGRADQVDKAALARLVKSINRVLESDTVVPDGTLEIPQIEFDRVFALGMPLAARALWEELGIGPAIRRCMAAGELPAPHETALFAMTADRLEEPGSKLVCATHWLLEVVWLPEAAELTVDQLYRALDFLTI